MSHDATIDIPMESMQNGDDAATLHGQSSTSQLRPSVTNGGSSVKHHRQILGRGRRPLSGVHGNKTGHVGYDGEEDTINTMGKLYKKIRDFSVVTRYLFYVVPLGALIAIPIIIGATSAKKTTIGNVPMLWFFVWIEIIWSSLWVSKIVAHFLPLIYEVFAGFVSSGVRKYSMVLRALDIPLSLVGWAVCSLATFKPLMTRNPGTQPHGLDPPNGKSYPWQDILQQILGAATVCTLVFLGEKFIIQLISIDYHRKQFHFRIKESKRNIYLLSLLYDASRALFPAYCNEFAEEDYTISDQLAVTLGLRGSKGPSHARSGSRTPMRVLHDLGRYGDKLTSAFGNVAHEITGKQVFDPNSSHSVVINALERPQAAEALAKRIWMSFVMEGREALLQEDLLEVLGSERRTDAEEAFAAIDQDGNGDISLDEMIMVVSEYGRERKAIATSMHDVDQAINVLDNLFGAVVFIAVVFIFVAFLNRSFVTTLATAGTALLSLSFVFSVTCQEVLGSCIFVFVKHPFDVGDRIDLGPDQFVVEHISLLFSVFRRASGANCGRSVQIPNIVLNNLWVENISRSRAMSEQFEIAVSFDTTFDDVQILKDELSRFVNDKDNSRDFLPTFEIGILGTTDQSKLTLQVEIRHKSNWGNETVRQARRSKFMCALVSSLKVVPIYGPGGGADAVGSSANPSYSVAVAQEVAENKVASAATTRANARLYPKKVDVHTNKLGRTTSGRTGPAGLTEHENKVVDNLTSRNPAYDSSRDQAWTSGREDDSTLGERMSFDQQQDLNEMRTMLRRESTKGRRKPNSEMRTTTVPTINTSYTDYGYQSSGYSATPTAYRPTLTSVPSQSVISTTSSSVPQLPQVATATSPLEMRQLGRNASNPYRQPSQSLNRKPMGTAEEDEEGRRGTGGGGNENTRPYAGV
ncbi:hypothetical protein LTR62_008396 [Meristemomyces frigidus]|uniref:EF-hand domain-containing protein n=1 Tax=Meristemomyces frigidus TaxID=1508187 RepID=A0AAN7T9J2_9PEZI|nr:hypothetical protein LTR62_008396 [Meristemomyces frigidus]